jgi:hypothetical protein
MKQISVIIKDGKVTATAPGYKGTGCEGPIAAIKAAIGGKVQKEEATAEAFEHEEEACVELQDEQVI